jgi:hypothetical protein
MLGTEGGCEPDIGPPRKCIQGMGEVICHGSRMGQQRHAPSLQGLAQCGLLQQAVDAEFHGFTPLIELIK